jgi:hypothetical protein
VEHCPRNYWRAVYHADLSGLSLLRRSRGDSDECATDYYLVGSAANKDGSRLRNEL